MHSGESIYLQIRELVYMQSDFLKAYLLSYDEFGFCGPIWIRIIWLYVESYEGLFISDHQKTYIQFEVHLLQLQYSNVFLNFLMQLSSYY